MVTAGPIKVAMVGIVAAMLFACAADPGETPVTSESEMLAGFFEDDFAALGDRGKLDEITFDALTRRHATRPRASSWAPLQRVLDQHLNAVLQRLPQRESAIVIIFGRPLRPVASLRVTLVDQGQPIASTGGAGDIQLDAVLAEALFASVVFNAMIRAGADVSWLETYQALPPGDPAGARITALLAAPTDEDLLAVANRQIRETPTWEGSPEKNFVGAQPTISQLLQLARDLRATEVARARSSPGMVNLQRTALGRLLDRTRDKEDRHPDDPFQRVLRQPIFLQRLSDRLAEAFGSELDFILAHEVGHIALDHFRRIPLHPSCNDRKTLEQEADRFALALLLPSVGRGLYHSAGLPGFRYWIDRRFFHKYIRALLLCGRGVIRVRLPCGRQPSIHGQP